jgi:hypothetical protein
VVRRSFGDEWIFASERRSIQPRVPSQGFAFNEAEGSVARKSKVVGFHLVLQEPLVEIRSPIHTTSGRISVSVCGAETI